MGEAIPSADWSQRWEGIEGAHWVAEAERYDRMAAGFGEALLDAVGPAPGEQVLDVGCGNGAITIEAARRVRPGGRAVGLDLSSPMLALARERADQADVEEALFLHANAQEHDFSEGAFDAVVSRFGVMFFDDPNVAFANLARTLRPRGRLGFVAWQSLERSEWLLVPGAAAAAYIGMPEGIGPDEPGPFALGDPDRVRGILEGAGFSDISLDDVTRPMRIGADVDDAVAFLRSIPIVSELAAAASPDNESAALDAVREALTPYDGSDGVVMNDNSAWLVRATKR